jgi:hypothetical protein
MNLVEHLQSLPLRSTQLTRSVGERALQQRDHIVAWEAPGYDRSSSVCRAQPLAQEYGQRLWDWLYALGLTQVNA